MKLVIVESPGKVKKNQSFLGAPFRVLASVGHVRDLPEKEIGVEPPNFRPHYVPTDRGKDVLAKLASAAKDAEVIYLATDPDREGEAIMPWLVGRRFGSRNTAGWPRGKNTFLKKTLLTK